MELVIKPVPATVERMAYLEACGVISRIGPDFVEEPWALGQPIKKSKQGAAPGKSRVTTVYSTAEHYGPHKLISVSINTPILSQLISHPDREDFLLIGGSGATQLVLTVSVHTAEVLAFKRDKGTLCAEDFVALYCVMNDPLLSFFTMNPGYPHGETCVVVSDCPPSFFVGEPRDLPEHFFDLKAYTLTFDHGGSEQ